MRHRNEECDLVQDRHTNVLLDINNIPYLLGEYLDRRTIFSVQASELKNEIFIDQSERDSLRTVINVNIADLPYRSTTEMPFVFGNDKKKDMLERSMAAMANELNHQMDVLLPGIVVRVNFQLENFKTGRCVSSMCRDLPISDAVYGYFINPDDYTDNCILSNFSDSLIAPINEYAYGRQPMTFRITDIQLLYRKLSRFPTPHPVRQHLNKKSYDYGIYQYHEKLQARHTFGDPDNPYHHREAPENIAPPEWSMFSRFYHFDNRGHDIVLHMDEIMSGNVKVMEIPCGTTRVNRTFTVQPGQRVIFKISIWKNDIVVVNDAEWVAKALKSPCLDAYQPLRPPLKGSAIPHYLDRVEMKDRVDRRQDFELVEAKRQIAELTETVNRLKRMISDEPVEDLDPGYTLPPMVEHRPPKHHHYDHRPHGSGVKKKLSELEQAVKDLQESSGECDHEKLEASIQELMEEIYDIRANGADEVVTDRINEIEDSLQVIQDAVENSVSEGLTQEELDELIDKINNF